MARNRRKRNYRRRAGAARQAVLVLTEQLAVANRRARYAQAQAEGLTELICKAAKLEAMLDFRFAPATRAVVIGAERLFSRSRWRSEISHDERELLLGKRAGLVLVSLQRLIRDIERRSRNPAQFTAHRGEPGPGGGVRGEGRRGDRGWPG